MTSKPVDLYLQPGTQDRTQITRNALVVTALKLFGTKGFDATSTRQIADASGANIAAISYHFGSKENLRIEVARSVAAHMGQHGPVRASADMDNEAIQGLSPEQARSMIRQHIKIALDRDSLGPLADDILQFFHVEMTQESPVVDILFENALKHSHERMCRLVSRLNGEAWDSEKTKVAALMIFAQVMVFDLVRPVVLRSMGWDKIGPQERDTILDSAWIN